MSALSPSPLSPAGRRRQRWLGATAASGLLLGLGLAALGNRLPILHRALQQPLADALVALLALGTVASLVLWGRSLAAADRNVLVTAILVPAGLVTLANVLAPALGWWGGAYFAVPLHARLALAVVTGLSVAGGFALLLLLYRWVAARQRWLALLVWLLLLLASIPGILRADQIALRDGLIAFGNGYTLWADVAVGEVFLGLPLLLYEVLRHRGPVSAGPSGLRRVPTEQ